MNDLILPPSVINLVWQLVESSSLPGLIFLSSFFYFFLFFFFNKALAVCRVTSWFGSNYLFLFSNVNKFKENIQVIF